MHFTSSDSQAALPANSVLTAGVGVFKLTLKTAGSQALTAADSANSSITGSASVSVSPASVSHFVVTAPQTAAPATPFSVTLTAEDSWGNVAISYSGTVAFTASDKAAGVTLPGNYHFVSTDAGIHTFTGGVIFESPGANTLTATDTVAGSITGKPFVVLAAAALSIPTNITGARNGIAVVPIDINTLFDPINGHSGLEGADFIVNYNSSLFTVGSADVHLGSVPSASTGWSVLVNANTPGQLIIGLSNSGTGIITTTGGGSLVIINFHVNATAAFGTTSAVDLAADVAGGPPFTHVSDQSGKDYTLIPARSET